MNWKCILLLTVIVFFVFGRCSEGFEAPKLNIYGEPLQQCKTGVEPGSWMADGTCSELGGGVHQICFRVTDETSDFSEQTGQSDWSERRVNNNHCMCLGAWALYKAKGLGTGRELVCEAIPETALSPDYIGNWSTWNGNELDGQIIKGVRALYDQCSPDTLSVNQQTYITGLFETLQSQVNGL